MTESFWVKLTYKEFIGHYCEMTDAEIVADVRKSIGSFSNDRADGDDFGAKMVRKANARMNGEAAGASRANGQKGGRPKNITAAATTREAGDVSATGCNLSQVAPNSNAGDESSDAGNGAALKNATTCNLSKADGDTREDSLNVTDVSNYGTLESGTSANIYDQDAKVSANSPAGAGVNLDSAHKFEARLRPGEGSTPEIERKSASLPSPTSIKTDPKPTKKAKAEVKPEEQKYPHGEFENIMLTTKEYTSLCERLDDADSLIEEADQYFEAQPDKKRKYKSHYAMLLNWDRRRKEFEGVKPKKFKTAVDQDREEIKWLSDYYAKKERGENPPLPKIKMVGSA